MAGIMPEGGVSASGAFNSIPDPLLVDGCAALWYAPRCTPRFDPAAANAVIAEILNVMKCANIPYDCNAKDNLCRAIEHHIVAGRLELPYDDDDPIILPGGNNRAIGGGTFIIPNSYHEDIIVLAQFDSTFQFEQQTAGAGTRVQLRFNVDNIAGFPNPFVVMDQVVNGSNFAGGDFQQVQNTNATKLLRIPPGGRTFYWRVSSDTAGNDFWRLQYTERAMNISWYGVNGTQGDFTDNII